MANLLDRIKANRDQLGAEQAPMQDTTSKVQNLLRAKSGKAIGSSDASLSSLGEQAANDATNVALGQQASKARLQQASSDQQAQGQQLQTDLGMAEQDQSRKFQTLTAKVKTNQLMSELNRDKATLSLDKDRAKLEQAAFLMSMQDKQYTDKLQDIGRKRRLDNDANFKEEMAKMEFGSSLDLLHAKLGNKDVLSASDREFQKALASMGVNDALVIAEMQGRAAETLGGMEREGLQYGANMKSTAANIQGQAQGVSGVTSAGIGAYGKYKDSKSDEDAEDPGIGPNGVGG